MNNLRKNKEGYGYKYTDLSAIHEYLESIGEHYIQHIEVIDGNDYIVTDKYKGDEKIESVRGCRVVQATLSGKSNPAQEQGSALTYARRYSLLMAYGLATEDDDAASLTRTLINGSMEQALRKLIKDNNIPNEEVIEVLGNFGYKKLSEIDIRDIKEVQKALIGE
jgi:hypothetical protein